MSRVIGSGPIVIARPGGSTTRTPGLPGAARPRGWRLAGQLQPGHDHDGPRSRRRHYVEPITPEFVELIIAKEAPTRSCPPSAARPRENRGRPARERRPGEVRRRLIAPTSRRSGRGEDRQLFKDIVAGPGARRRARGLPLDGRVPCHRGRSSPAGGHPAVVHDGPASLGHGATTAPTSTPRRRRPPPRRRCTRCDRGERARLEGVRARADARAPTTSWSLPRSRTSTRWACTPATASRRPAMTLTDREYQNCATWHRGAARGRRGHPAGCNISSRSTRRTAPRGDRDETAGVPVERAGLEGDRFPIANRCEAGHRLHPRRIPNDITRKTPAPSEPAPTTWS